MGALMFAAAPSFGQVGNFPSKPIRIVVPFAPGGSEEVNRRMYIEKLTQQTGWQWVLDFKTGAGGTLGTTYVAKSSPDGHTLLQATAGFSVVNATYRTPPFDPLELEPVSMVHRYYSMLTVPGNSRFKNLNEYLAFARENPGKINVGHNGNGSVTHLALAWLHNITNTKVVFIPYKGGGDLNVALLAGQVDISSLGFTPHVKTGKLRRLAVPSDQRLPDMPDLQTVAESVPGYEWSNWTGFLAPGKTPKAIVDRISLEFQKAAKDPDSVKRLAAGGFQSVGSTPEQYRKVIATDVVRWVKVAKDIGYQPED